MGKTTEEMPDNYTFEDLALKTAAQYFGKELLPYLGVKEKLRAVTPTANMHLEARQMYQDFNYVTGDGSCLHLEFESDSLIDEDLRRFREYEATTGRIYKVPVTTCVICSSKVKHIRSELKCGMNTYRVQIVRLKDHDADKILKKLFTRISKGKRLRKRDLILAVLTPLMSGESSLKERIIAICRLLKNEQEETSKDEVEKLQAITYSFAVKFLTKEELQEVKGVFNMTILGQMIWEDAMQEGKIEGEERFAALSKELLDAGENDLLLRAVSDKVFREELYKKFEL